MEPSTWRIWERSATPTRRRGQRRRSRRDRPRSPGPGQKSRREEAAPSGRGGIHDLTAQKGHGRPGIDDQVNRVAVDFRFDDEHAGDMLPLDRQDDLICGRGWQWRPTMRRTGGGGAMTLRMPATSARRQRTTMPATFPSCSFRVNSRPDGRKLRDISCVTDSISTSARLPPTSPRASCSETAPPPSSGQPFVFLAALLKRPGELVTREELRQRLWPDGTFVEHDLGLNKAAAKLRDALGDDAASPRYIKTLPKRGYRFVGLD